MTVKDRMMIVVRVAALGTALAGCAGPNGEKARLNPSAQQPSSGSFAGAQGAFTTLGNQ